VADVKRARATKSSTVAISIVRLPLADRTKDLEKSGIGRMADGGWRLK